MDVARNESGYSILNEIANKDWVNRYRSTIMKDPILSTMQNKSFGSMIEVDTDSNLDRM